MGSKSKRCAFFCVVWTIGIALLAIFVLNACGSDPTAESVAEMFESRWEFNLPDDMELEYYERERLWFGDGIRYAVFKVKAEPANFIVDFSNKKDETFAAIVNELTDNAEFEIPNSFLPDWEFDYSWKHIGNHIVDSDEPLRYFDNIYLMYFPSMLRLIICEYLI